MTDYADNEVCWYCGDNDGFVRWYHTAMDDTIPLCSACYKKFDKEDGEDGYRGALVVERCSKCHQHTNVIWRLYKKGDKVGKHDEVKKCRNCEKWFAWLINGYCEECQEKSKVRATLLAEREKVRCPKCEVILKPMVRHDLKGKTYAEYECWKCGWEDKKLLWKGERIQPYKVRVFI